MEARFVNTNGYNTHVLLGGARGRPAVVLLHGGGPGASAQANWERVIKDLADEFYVIAPDMVGFGKTEHPEPRPTSGLGWTGLRVQQILSLLDALEIDRANLVGNSMGGYMSLQLLLSAPERFQRAVLMGSAGGQFEPTPELNLMRNFYQDPRLERYREIIRNFVYDVRIFPDFEGLVRLRYESAMQPETRRSYEAMMASGGPITVPPASLGSIEHNILLIHGRYDRIVPLQSSIYLLSHLPHAELVVLDRCGHWVQIERWDAMGPLVRRFFRGEN